MEEQTEKVEKKYTIKQIILFIVVVIFGMTMGSGVLGVILQKEQPEASQQAVTTESTQENTQPVEEEIPGTVSQQNAIRAAKHYLENMPFSEKGLIKQLAYEGYSEEDATFAVQNLNVQWNEVAVIAAKHYLENQAFSEKGLIKQLSYEGYSEEDAIYGVQNIEVDWNEQAAIAAKHYLENQSFSRSGLIKQLKYEGYTTEQATYGVDQTGL